MRSKHDPKQNRNCLKGMRCPKCGSIEPFSILGESTFVVYDSGTDEFGDVGWGDDSACWCRECGFQAKVEDFKTKQQPKDGNHQFGPIGIVVSEKGRKITLTDSTNPRIHAVYRKCHGEDCPEWIEEDEVNWATSDGKLNTDTGNPYCDSCLPEEEE